MKKFIVGLLVALAVGTTATAQTAVRGYTKADGTYVAPHYRSSPNNTTSDNYSTRGNVNPYTGEAGTKPDTRPSYSTPSYTPSQAPKPSNTYGSPSPYGSTYGSNTKPACASIYGC
jgi:hypothetical protein